MSGSSSGQLVDNYEDFFQPSQTASAPSELSRAGETTRDCESRTCFVEDTPAEGPNPQVQAQLQGLPRAWDLSGLLCNLGLWAP